MAIDKSQIEAKLGQIIDPNSESDLVSSKAVKSIELEGDGCKIEIQLGYPAAGYFEELKQQIQTAVATIDGMGSIDVEVTSLIKSHAVQQNLKPQVGIKNIIGRGGQIHYLG